MHLFGKVTKAVEIQKNSIVEEIFTQYSLQIPFAQVSQSLEMTANKPIIENFPLNIKHPEIYISTHGKFGRFWGSDIIFLRGNLIYYGFYLYLIFTYLFIYLFSKKGGNPSDYYEFTVSVELGSLSWLEKPEVWKRKTSIVTSQRAKLNYIFSTLIYHPPQIEAKQSFVNVSTSYHDKFELILLQKDGNEKKEKYFFFFFFFFF